MQEELPRAHNDPDLPAEPEPFGYKTAWFALRSEDSQAVASALELKNVMAANWRFGVWRSGNSDEYRIFVTPTVRGWVLATGTPILYEADDHAAERIVDLSRQFGDAQFFCSMRTSSSYIWARALDGKLIRNFYDCDGAHREIGAPTAAEETLGLNYPDFASPEASEPGYWKRKDLNHIDEERVLNIAELWSVNPLKIPEMGLPHALGLLGDPSSSYPPKPGSYKLKKPSLLQRLFTRRKTRT